jgi:hypothetical protein
MATATAPDIVLDRPRALKLSTARNTETDARRDSARRERKPARAARGHDAHGDVTGIVGGSGILLIQACALIPGLLPCLLLAGAFALPLLLPAVALGVVAGVLVGLPVGLWRLVRRLLIPS